MIENKEARESLAILAQQGLEKLKSLGRDDLVKNFENLLSHARAGGILQEVLADYAGLIKDAVVEAQDKKINGR